MNLSQLSDRMVRALKLDLEPVALAFADQAPPGVPQVETAVPSSCAFWVQALTRVFFAPAAVHENCPVGVLTMGFPMNAQVQSKLSEFVTRMCHVSYLGSQEPESIPKISHAMRGILYGPLSQFSWVPDLALVWVNGRQAMLLEEALGAVCWDAIEKTQTFGRPACAALAVAVRQQRPTLSLGCAGMRTFTSIGDDKLLISIPESQLQLLQERLDTTLRANHEMLDFYRQHQRNFIQSN